MHAPNNLIPHGPNIKILTNMYAPQTGGSSKWGLRESIDIWQSRSRSRKKNIKKPPPRGYAKLQCVRDFPERDVT